MWSALATPCSCSSWRYDVRLRIRCASRNWMHEREKKIKDGMGIGNETGKQG